MDGYFIKSSRVTQSVDFHFNMGLLDLCSRSSQENRITFCNYTLESIQEFADGGVKSSTENGAFEYFNTSSSKCLSW